MALNHTTSLNDDTDATLALDTFLTNIEELNRKPTVVIIGVKAIVVKFDHDPNQSETLTFSNQADFKARYRNSNTVVLYK